MYRLSKDILQDFQFYFWRMKCTVLGDDINNTNSFNTDKTYTDTTYTDTTYTDTTYTDNSYTRQNLYATKPIQTQSIHDKTYTRQNLDATKPIQDKSSTCSFIVKMIIRNMVKYKNTQNIWEKSSTLSISPRCRRRSFLLERVDYLWKVRLEMSFTK